MKQAYLDTFCMLRITPKTTDKSVKNFLHYLFDGYHEARMEQDILEKINDFRVDNCRGKLVYNLNTGMLNLKEDIPK